MRPKPRFSRALIVAFGGVVYAQNVPKLAFSLCLMLAVGAAQAQKIYKYSLSNGDVVYSDRPPAEDQGEEIKLGPLQGFSLPPAPPLEDSTAKNKDPAPVGYEDFKVTSPTNDATLRDNGGNVRVSLSLSPRLRRGHSIEVMVDGQPIGSGNDTSVTLTGIDRGTHTVQAAVKDNAGKEIARSNSVIFHLKRGGG